MTPANPIRTTPRRRRCSTALVALVVAVLIAGACSGGDDEAADADTTTAPTTAPARTTTTVDDRPAVRHVPFGHPVPVGAPQPTGGPVAPPVAVSMPAESLVAATRGGDVHIFAAPGGPEIQVLPPSTGYGSVRTFLVASEQPGWVEVFLPTRPNGSRGWVPKDQINLRRTRLAVAVDIDARVLTVFDGGAPIITTSVAVGRSGAPTPRGLAYVTDVIATPSPGGVYGPYALALSHHSEVFSEFGNGDGQVAMHGTNQPELMGSAVSSGCVRMPNATLVQMVGLLPLGTPVQII